MTKLANYIILDQPPEGFQLKATSNSNATLHYQTIGKILLVSEASSFRVGIPWLPPSKRTRTLREPLEESIESFVRVSLVSVSTKQLESYLEDLENLSDDETQYGLLFLEVPSAWERYALSACAFVLVFCLGVCTLLAFKASIEMSLLVAALASGSGAWASSLFCSEEHRRTSFYWILHREVLRRKGINNSGFKQIPLCSAKPEA